MIAFCQLCKHAHLHTCTHTQHTRTHIHTTHTHTPHTHTHTHTTHTHTHTHTQVDEKASEGSQSAAIVNLAKALEDGSLAQDPFIQEYRAKRLDEMKQQAKLGAQRYEESGGGSEVWGEWGRK